MRSAVLFISPQAEDANRLSEMLSPLPMVFDHVPDLQQARAKLGHRRYRVILTEAGLPDGSWLDVLTLAHGSSPVAEVIVTDPQADSRFWSEALNLGAYDLLAQPFCESEVVRILSNACSRMAPEHTVRAVL
jgi:DNA-binding NtrC family response regulator